MIRALLIVSLSFFGMAAIGCDDEVAELETPQGEVEIEEK